MATLLVVNDDPVQLHLLASLLEQDHDQVIRFSCSKAAWEWLQAGHSPDGIVLDLHMPGINGWRFCELLHTEGPPGFPVPPVLIVSATYSGADVEDVLSAMGASAFLALPAEPTCIREQVRQLLNNASSAKGFHVWVNTSNESEMARIRSTFVSRGWQVHGWCDSTQMQTATELSVPDIIIIDCPVANVMTLDSLRWCRRTYPDALCLVLGPHADMHELSISDHPDAWLPKGCDMQNLLALCEKWRWERALTRIEHLLEIRTSDLKDSEAQFRGLFEMLPDILVIYDEQGIIQHINSCGAEQLGYAAKDLIGSSLVSIQSPNMIASFAGEADLGHRFSNWGEASLRTKDGLDLPVEHMERIVPFQGKRQTLFVARDMTTRLQMAHENAVLEQQLRQVQKMEAVGRLASGVAHDMNNILTAILAHAGLLKAQGHRTDPSWKAGDVIEKAVHRGKELTSQLLGFARQGKHHHVPVDIHSVIQEVTGLLGRTVNKGITLKTDLIADEPWVLGDPNQLYQVLMNLAVNASDAMSSKGELIFHTSNETVSASQASTIPGLTAGDYVVVRVVDTGEGMAQDVLAHIFEPFFTTKEQGKGTGMGLAMVYGIVKNHHGYIGVTSTLGAGTTIRVYLPSVLCDEPSMISSRMAMPSEATGHVLIVDDEEAVAEAAQAILEYLGYSTTIRLSGPEALAYLQDDTHSVDLVVLDMVMPDMTGPECFAEVRRIRPESKILLCTGYDRNHAVQELLNEGMVGFIQKPYDLDDLAQICANMLKQPLSMEPCLSGNKT